MTARTLESCGTQAAYKRHIRAGEKPCTPCRVANRTAARDQRDRRRRGTTSPAEHVGHGVPVAPQAPQDPAKLANTLSSSSAPATALGDLAYARAVLVAAIEKVAIEDPTRLAPLTRELRETRKSLDRATAAAPPAGEDDFQRARRRRDARRNSNITERPL